MVVELTEQPQLIPYTVEDVDGQKSTAIIWVPGIGQQVPTLAKDDVVEVIAGQSVTVDLKEWVKVRDGRSPRLTQTDRIKLIGSDGSDPVAGNGTAINYTAGAGLCGTRFHQLRSHRRLRPRRSRRPEVHAQHPHQGAAGSQPEQPARPCWAASVDVPKGESAEPGSWQADLGSRDRDDVDNMKYELVGDGPAGFNARIDGKTLKASVDGPWPRARQGPSRSRPRIPGDSKPPQRTSWLLPPPTGPSRWPTTTLNPTRQPGKPVTVNVLANDSNPFPETPLKIVSAVNRDRQRRRPRSPAAT